MIIIVSGYEIRGTLSGEHQHYGPLEYDAMQFGRWILSRDPNVSEEPDVSIFRNREHQVHHGDR